MGPNAKRRVSVCVCLCVFPQECALLALTAIFPSGHPDLAMRELPLPLCRNTGEGVFLSPLPIKGFANTKVNNRKLHMALQNTHAKTYGPGRGGG